MHVSNKALFKIEHKLNRESPSHTSAAVPERVIIPNCHRILICC